MKTGKRHFAWTMKMSVGIPVIDDQHQRFFDLLNGIEDSVSEGQDRKAVAELVRELVNYMQVHFQTEEDFMKERFFNDYPEHREEHMRFSNHVKELAKKFRAKEGVDALEIRHFMVDWLSKHIMQCDQKYAKFIAKYKASHPI